MIGLGFKHERGSPRISYLNEEGFLGNVDNVVATDPEAGWRIVADNLNTHCCESMVRYVAHARGVEEDLGEKELRGILASQENDGNS